MVVGVEKILHKSSFMEDLWYLERKFSGLSFKKPTKRKKRILQKKIRGVIYDYPSY